MSRMKAIRFILAARHMACVLVGALLLLEGLAASGQFHQSLHHEGKTASNTCVLCLLAKGQVDTADISPVFTAPFLVSPKRAPLIDVIPFVDFRYLSSPSRAPPVSSLLLSVVA
jgi:hypothetical protein